MKIIFKYILITLSLIVLIYCVNFIQKETVNKNEQTQPNILFIFPDQFRNAAVGINNQDPVYTPNLDKLAKEGMVISNAISNYPLCSPYRGMLMTGKLPYNNSILSNSNSKRYKYNNSWQKDDISISDVLVNNGYDAGYVGKLHLMSPPPIKGKDTVLWDAYQPKELRHGFNFWYAYGTFDQHNNPHYWINDANEEEITYVNEWSPKHEADVIIDYIKHPSTKTRSKDKPFALFWSVNPPHPPYQYVPEKYLKHYKDKSLDELLVRQNVDLNTDAKDLTFHSGATRKRTYLAKEHVKNHFAMITGVDEQIGRVLKALKDEGLEENTIVVITSDHGEMMGSHGLMSKNVWFEEAINVPFIIKWPKKIKGNQKSDLIVSATDIMPTLLNMVEATEGIPTNIDGKDLSSIILVDKGDKPTSALYYFILEGKPESGHRGIRTHRHTYVITIDKKNVERKFLYDNKKDPYQKTNLIGKADNTEKRLHAELLKNLREKKDPWLEKYQNLE
ncbi:sulfatase [Flavivirga spongiicola]|uniref:Sulfatase n=1 Tax=Flavivirga spongiicola TaxID=421621 RepID=A0ABU7XWM3_9FLAO|nr:sulfatase [Flavivirga sp. MEBiC05379]MDO5980174.1 sulfatase [Flavivirga sp. MEBiC05379]